jgi:glycerol-3-phosphate dehydrogenase (NAD(P)+)
MSTQISGRAIAVLGAGSWGTALAIHCARSNHRTLLWGRDPTRVAAIAADRSNRRYLPEAQFPANLQVSDSLSAVLAAADDVLLAVPSHAFRGVLDEIAPMVDPEMRVAWATKGFELETGKLPHQVAAQILGDRVPVAVLSGPTFAREVGAGLPTAMTVAASEPGFAVDLATSLSGLNFRAYTSDDLVGVEVGGAVKNALAIGAGISDGLGFGANTRVALITRGLVEMTRLGVALGAKAATFMGLAGLGDLVLTCTDDQSRNRRFGLALASGSSGALLRVSAAVHGTPPTTVVERGTLWYEPAFPGSTAPFIVREMGGDRYKGSRTFSYSIRR